MYHDDLAPPRRMSSRARWGSRSAKEHSLSFGPFASGAACSFATMFLVDWFFRFVVWTDPRHQNWLFPAEGWVVEHLGKEQARLLLKDKRRQDAADAEMQRLMYEKSAFGLQYVAPVIKGAVELLAPSGVEEKAGQAVADIRDLAGGRECLSRLVL